jgi:predicted RNA-binding protein (virulence factor B family)
MYKLGRYNELKITREVEFGVYLSDDEGNEILLPAKQRPSRAEVGDTLELFVYNDSEDRPIATVNKPRGCVDDIVALEVVDILPSIGAFLDWGLEKDILLPFKHQKRTTRLKVGDHLLVKIMHDTVSDRLIASTRIMTLYDPRKSKLKNGDAVTIQIAEPHERGFIVVINDLFHGMLFSSDVSDSLSIGEKKQAYIKNIRDDGKIDISLKPIGLKAITDDKQVVFAKLKESRSGFLPFNSKSSPDDLAKHFHLSKKAFKKAIGGLYKEHKIKITDEGIELT